MVPDIGWFELLVIATLAIIVVGPKDLPKMLRTVGQFMAKARSMAREFQRSFSEMARETELDELRKEVDSLKANNPISQAKRDIKDAINPLKDDLKTPVDGDAFGGQNPTGTSSSKGNSTPSSEPKQSGQKQ